MNGFDGTVAGSSAAEKAGTSKERKDSRKFDASIGRRVKDRCAPNHKLSFTPGAETHMKDPAFVCQARWVPTACASAKQILSGNV